MFDSVEFNNQSTDAVFYISMILDKYSSFA